MHKPFKQTRDAVYKCPLFLSQDERFRAIADQMLTRSIGIEFEATVKIDHKIVLTTLAEKIPNIMDVDIDLLEQRFRIPPGIKGMLCLWEICELMKEYCIPTDSGIHYHVDCPEFDLFEKISLDYSPLTQWMLDSVKCWNYKGTANKWVVSYQRTAIKLHKDYRTIEYRIGEMSFDYELIIKRILHANNITNKAISSLKSLIKTKAEKSTLPKYYQW